MAGERVAPGGVSMRFARFALRCVGRMEPCTVWLTGLKLRTDRQNQTGSKVQADGNGQDRRTEQGRRREKERRKGKEEKEGERRRGEGERRREKKVGACHAYSVGAMPKLSRLIISGRGSRFARRTDFCLPARLLLRLAASLPASVSRTLTCVPYSGWSSAAVAMEGAATWRESR